MEIIKIAVCEDLQTERELMIDILDKSQYPTSVQMFETGEEFLASFRPHKYDLIFMDIFMDKITGIEVIAKVREIDKDVSVAFTTSSLDYTLESYRLGAVKYIEKPATKKDVEEALKIAHYNKLEEDCLLVRNHNGSESYPIEDIICLEQKGRNSLIHLSGGETVTTKWKITDLEDQLDGKNFLRCHKSYIVNLAFVQSIDSELMIFKMTEGENVHMSRKLFWGLKKEFENYLFDQKG